MPQSAEPTRKITIAVCRTILRPPVVYGPEDPTERGFWYLARLADEEDHDRDLERHLAPVQVAELPVERAGDGGGEQVRGDHPRQVLEPTEVADDRRQRSRHDRLIERREQDDEDQRTKNQPDALLALLDGAHPPFVPLEP